MPRARWTARRLAPLLVGALLGQRLLELRLARRHEAWARERGAVEYGRGHYPLFFLLHAGWLLGLLSEGRAGRGRARPFWLILLLLAQPVRYWVIRSLGKQWNTRILIVPGAGRVKGGPYRWLRHPNYLVVGLEMAAAPLSVGAWCTALIGSLLNAALLGLIRLPAEERALAAYDRTGDRDEAPPVTPDA